MEEENRKESILTQYLLQLQGRLCLLPLPPLPPSPRQLCPAAPRTTIVAWFLSMPATVNAAVGVAAASGSSQNLQAPAVVPADPAVPDKILEALSVSSKAVAKLLKITTRVATCFAKAIEEAVDDHAVVATMLDEAKRVLEDILESRNAAQSAIAKVQAAGNMPTVADEMLAADTDARSAYVRLTAAIALLDAGASASQARRGA